VFLKKPSVACHVIIFSLLLCTCASNPQGRAGRSPDWVNDPYARFDRQAYVAAVGSGRDRQAAERSALANLVAIFGQGIFVDERIQVSYQEAVRSGAAARWSEDTLVENLIVTTAGMESLLGAEISAVWFDGRQTYYAAAVLNRARARSVYSERVMANQLMIHNLTNFAPEERNTLEAVARYQFAATIADITESYSNLLSYIGLPSFDVIRGDELRLRAMDIAGTIPIAIDVQNDRSGRIHVTFARVLSDFGFITGGLNSRYVLNVAVALSPADGPGSAAVWTRIELNAVLTDTRTGTSLAPFSFSSRESHNNREEADLRAILSAERRISQEYPQILNNHLFGALERR
jgi:hypothetical protein